MVRGKRRGPPRKFAGVTLMTQRQVAQELGISVSSVCQAERRALEKIRKAIGEEEERMERGAA